LVLGGRQTTAGTEVPQRGVRVAFVVVQQEAAALVRPQPRIVALRAQRQQLGVRALLDDAPGVQHDQAVHARDGGQAVRDREMRWR
jgi:hypothetical protein